MYLPKELILSAYAKLATLSADPTQQGATQRVSAIRYFLAMDAFEKRTDKQACDTKIATDRHIFNDCVCNVVAISQSEYSPAFYVPLKSHSGDCGTGSNFYSAGQVNISLTTASPCFYPKRSGWLPLLTVKAGKVSIYREAGKTGYDNLPSYISTEEQRTALFVWLARKWDGFQKEDTLCNDLKTFALKHYSLSLIESIFPPDLEIKSFVEGKNHLLSPKEEILSSAVIEQLFKSGKSTAVPLSKLPLQLISYGAPGTGKSKDVNDVAAKLPPEDVVRTTFHPDSDYASFVGAYKPKMTDVPRTWIVGEEIKKIIKGEAQLLTERQISYEFVPQAFTKAYVQAWRRMAAAPMPDGTVAPVMLVIEEINRGDCAKIFGDLFQLLDRRVTDNPNGVTKAAGFSEYPILADDDLADCIRRALTDEEKTAIAAKWPRVVADERLELMLPPNLRIWATMNTSDQSLFPMDSAFKRRWDWQYKPIRNHPNEGWTIAVGDERYYWWDFLQKVNQVVLRLTRSEDKQLGYFFVHARDKTVDAETFVNKVLFFLWNGVFKDCADEPECDFLKNGEGRFTFRDFFDDKGRAHTAHVVQFLKALKVEPASSPSATAS